MKYCKKCDTLKPVDLFYKNKKSKDGLTHYCKNCSKSYYYSVNVVKEKPKIKTCNKCKLEMPATSFYNRKHREDGLSTMCKRCLVNASIASRFRLTIEQYEAMLLRGCEACGSFEKLCIDHDHSCCPGQVTCGKCIRGVLCGNCNSAEGFIKSINQASGLIKYMKEKGALMSRGLADGPEPEEKRGPTNEELHDAFQDIAGFVGMLSARLEALEDVIAKAIKVNLPEEEAVDKKRIKGL